MDLVCKSCDSKDFITENYERICTSCGEVQDELVEEGRLCMLPDNEAIVDSHRNKDCESNLRLTNRIRSEGNSSNERRQVCRLKLLDETRRVVKQLVKHANAVDETMDLFEAVLKAYNGRLLSSKKSGLAGACVYYLGAKHQLGVSLADICKVFAVKMKIMTPCLKQVRELCPDFEYERPNIQDLVKKFIDEMSTKSYEAPEAQTNSNNSCTSTSERNRPQPLIDIKDRVVLKDRVMLLLDLFGAMHPYKQPSPQIMVAAVVYHAWRSLDTFKMIALNLSSVAGTTSPASAEETKLDTIIDTTDQTSSDVRVKHSISYERFCQICGFRYSSNGYKIVNKLQSSLLMLGKYLGNVNKINLPWYLKDIIDNSPHLIQEHMRTDTTTAAATEPKL